MAQDVKSSTEHAAHALTTGHSISTSSTSRPTSSYTLESTFADSAVGMEATTPIDLPAESSDKEARYTEPAMPPSPEDVDQSLSDKMRRLAAVAWTLEQDDSMNASRRRKLHGMLETLEAQLEDSSDDGEIGLAAARSKYRPPQTDDTAELEDVDGEDDEDVWIEESDIIAVRDNISATVRAIRQRHEEQEHLAELTTQKLEAVAQRCLEYERQAQHLLEDLERLRNENRTLGSQNDELRGHLSQMQEDASRTEVAVEAMSSAVAGLEGWIESTHPSRDQTPVPTRNRRARVVIRGKGRFRGRYYVDEDGDEAVAYSLADAASENQDLHDGVKAWLRGFRDVEEELRQLDSPASTRPQGRFRSQDHRDIDDWGDFETAQT